MTESAPLKPILEAHWATPYNKLPDDIQAMVLRAFSPIHWDWLSIDERKAHVVCRDYTNDPTNESKNQQLFKLALSRTGLEFERYQIEGMRANTPLELESKKRQMAEIAQIVASLDAQLAAPSNPNETPKQRDARLLKRRKELRAAGSNNPTQTLAREFGINDSLVRRIIRNSKPKPKPKKPGGILR